MSLYHIKNIGVSVVATLPIFDHNYISSDHVEIQKDTHVGRRT